MIFNKSSFNSSDAELVKNLQQGIDGRRKEEEQLFNCYVYFIREGMSNYSLSEDEAFDAYSDTILQGIENIINRSFENRSSLKTYLYRIFSNKCVDLIRKKTTNKGSVHQTSAISGMLHAIADPAKTIIQQMIEGSDIEMLKKKLLQLGENCRELLSMFAEGYTDREIAAATKYKSPDVVKTSRLRCLDKLRQLYKV